MYYLLLVPILRDLAANILMEDLNEKERDFCRKLENV